MSDEVTCVGHEPCPACGSRDNLARYSDGHGFCFGCQHYEHGTGEKKPAKRKERVSGLLDGEVQALAKRGITEETCAHWNYRVGEHKGKKVQIANFCNKDGEVVAQKSRDSKKNFCWHGEEKKALPLYGQWLWRDAGKMLVVTEGEIDALSVSQVQHLKWPVVSVPNGAAGAAKSVGKAIEWLERFEKVVFLFDDDEPGRDAAKECAELLTPGRAFIARVPGYKDANEALVAGQGKLIIDSLWAAKEYRPDGVIAVEDIIEQAEKPIEMGIAWPWPTLTKATYGIRPREIYTIGAGVGIGKSDIFKEIALHLTQQGHKVGCLFLEEPPAQSLKRMAGKLAGKRFHVPGVQYSPSELRLSLEALKDKVYLYDHFGAMDYETIKERMRYMIVGIGCKLIFLDHLTALCAAIEGDDERKQIDKMMADLAGFTQQLDFTLFAVSHLATPEGKSHEEGGRVLEKHFRGSRAIAQWSHFMFGLERDKQQPEQITTFRVLKDRYTGDATGLTFGLLYDRDTGRVTECELPKKEDRKHAFKEEDGEDF